MLNFLIKDSISIRDWYFEKIDESVKNASNIKGEKNLESCCTHINGCSDWKFLLAGTINKYNSDGK